MKKLSRSEKYLFGLSRSKATAASAQREAIFREGLTGLTSRDIQKIRRESWRKSRERHPETPVWVLALQQSYSLSWRTKLPKGVKPGVLRDCYSVRAAAYSAVDWGRLRKHTCGRNSPCGAGVREETNGKGGWDKVVWRYADYGCVLSPDGKKVAYSIKPRTWLANCGYEEHWTVSLCFRGRFFLDGRPVRLNVQESPRYRIRLRDCLRLLKNAGYSAYLTRQTKEQIATGSGVRGRTGELVLIVDFGRFGFFHAVASRHVVQDTRDALAYRERNYEQSELEAIVAHGEAEGVYVCAADSYRAGNCRPGTASFAETHHLDLGRHYAAGELLSVSNGNTRFVRAAVIAALRRERREAKEGVCLIADHRA
jgi:hypothetical protein